MHDKIEDLILVKMFQKMFGYYVLERKQNWKLVRIDSFKFRNMEYEQVFTNPKPCANACTSQIRCDPN